MAGRQLVFVQQPTQVRIPNAIEPPVQLEIRIGDHVDSKVVDGEVKLSILSGPPGGEIIGTSTARCPNGVATFDDLRFNVPGTYTLIAECDEDSLVTIPRPSAYRYYGAFDLTVGQQVEIMGDGSTTGSVSEVGDGYIIVQDNSATPQQGVVAGAEGVTVGSVPAENWFAADAPGLDLTDSAALWHVDGLLAPEVAGRFDPLAINPVPTNTPRNVPAPTGSDRGIAATPETGFANHSYIQSGNVPVVSGQNITAMFLACYPPNGRGPANGAAFSEMLAAGGFPGGHSIGGGAQQSGVHCRVSGQWAFSVPDVIRHGRHRWHLLGLSRRPRDGNWQPIDVYVDGQLIKSGAWSYNGVAGPLSGIRQVITHGAAVCQIGIWSGIKDDAWHLEQARRCGVAP